MFEYLHDKLDHLSKVKIMESEMQDTHLFSWAAIITGNDAISRHVLAKIAQILTR